MIELSKFFQAEWLMPGAAVVGVIGLIVLAFFRKTENRHPVCVVLSMAQTYVFVLILLVIVLSFMVKYIPIPSSNRCVEDRISMVSLRVRLTQGRDRDSDRDFYRENFSDLLTVLGVLGTLVGVIIPLIVYLLQLKSLKNESDSIRKLFHFHRSKLAQEQRELRHQLESLKYELDVAKQQCENISLQRDIVSRAQLDAVRSNMEAQLMIYRIADPKGGQKGMIVKTFILQFLDFLRIISYIPNSGPFDSDVARFREAMKLIRTDAKSYKLGVESLVEILKDMPAHSITGLSIALSDQDYKYVKRELMGIVPSLFSD